MVPVLISHMRSIECALALVIHSKIGSLSACRELFPGAAGVNFTSFVQDGLMLGSDPKNIPDELF